MPNQINKGDSAKVSVSFAPISTGSFSTTLVIPYLDKSTNTNAYRNVILLGTVNKGNQSITFDSIPNQTYLNPRFKLSYSVSSGLTPAFVSSDTNVAQIKGDSVIVKNAGTTIITASQAGNVDFNPAPNVLRTLVVNKAPQTITMTKIGNRRLGDASFAIQATASSGLTLAFSSSDLSVFRINVAGVNNYTGTIYGKGQSVVTASQSGNANYLAATAFLDTIKVLGKAQTITFGTLSDMPLGSLPAKLSASSTSALKVNFSSSDTNVVKVRNDSLVTVAVGSALIQAYQSGDATWDTATSVFLSVNVTSALLKNQTITFNPLASVIYGASPKKLTATASSGLKVNFSSSDTNVVKVRNDSTVFVNAGTATIYATQSGDAVWNPAPSFTQSQVVSKASQVVTFAPIDSILIGTDLYRVLVASASSGLPVRFTSANTNFATIVKDTAFPQGVLPGLVTITAIQDGNTNYLTAQSTQNLKISVKGGTFIAQTVKYTSQGLLGLSGAVHLYNLQGQLIWSGFAQENKALILPNKIQSGVFWLKSQTGSLLKLNVK